MTSACAVVVLAKAPLAGFAKTRLIPLLGPAGAARLAVQLLDHAVRVAVASQVGPVTLHCTPGTEHPAFVRLAARYDLTLRLQTDGDLGRRMSHALAEALAAADCAVLIGTDAPGLDCACLRLAAVELSRHDAVFIPALDGGYALVGLRRPAPALFADIEWSTPRVMAQTRAQARVLGLRCAELTAVADIDEPDDLRHLPLDWPARASVVRNVV